VGNPGFSSGEACWESLYVYNGTPYVAYQDCANGDKATVMKYAFGVEYSIVNGMVCPHCGYFWQLVGNPDFSSGEAEYESLCVYNGTP